MLSKPPTYFVINLSSSHVTDVDKKGKKPEKTEEAKLIQSKRDLPSLTLTLSLPNPKRGKHGYDV